MTRKRPGPPSATTPTRLLRAARAVLIEEGGDLEMSAVARAAGVSIGLAYHYFGSKAGLVAAVVDEFHERLDGAAVMALIDLPDWAARERERVERVIEFHYADPLAPVVLGKLRREPAVLEIEQARFERQLRQGAANMRSGQRQGAVAADLDPASAAAFVLGGVRALVAHALASHPSSRPKPGVLAERAWRLVLGAVRPARPSTGSLRPNR